MARLGVRLILPVLLAAFAGVVAFAAPRNSSEGNLPEAVTGWLAQAKQDCPSGFRDAGAIVTADLTGDGKTAYVADPHNLVCAGSPHLYGSAGPASIEIFVTSQGGEVVQSRAVLALGYKIVPAAGGPPVLAFETHNREDRAGSLDSYRWDGREFVLISHGSMAEPPQD